MLAYKNAHDQHYRGDYAGCNPQNIAEEKDVIICDLLETLRKLSGMADFDDDADEDALAVKLQDIQIAAELAHAKHTARLAI